MMSLSITRAMPWNLEEPTVTLHEHVVQPNDLVNKKEEETPRLQSSSPIAVIVNFIKKTLTITEWEIRKIRHDASDLVTRAIQPALWLLVFGEVFTKIRAIPTGSQSYLA